MEHSINSGERNGELRGALRRVARGEEISSQEAMSLVVAGLISRASRHTGFEVTILGQDVLAMMNGET